MRLSTKTRYGVRAMFDIAFHHQGQTPRAAQAKEIARREDIPLRYLEQIFHDLKRAGLVDSKRGPRGGYYLTRSPAEITLADVVQALQGPLETTFVPGDEPLPQPQAQKSSRHLTQALWKELAEHVQAWFGQISIADLVKRGTELGVPRAPTGQPMYFI